MADYISGDPRDAQTTIGPMVSRKQWQRVQDYIRLGQQEGARLLIGGEGRPPGMEKGWCVKPTVFSDVHNQMRIAREEIFGPVLVLISWQGQAQAIAIANDTTYGLSALVLSGDRQRAQEVALAIESGRVLVNTLEHEPQAPFGGFKQSGLGRMGNAGLSGVENDDHRPDVRGCKILMVRKVTSLKRQDMLIYRPIIY